MKTNIPRNQHYVPKTYLKNFAILKGKQLFVDVYDLWEKKGFRSNIKNICGEKDLYTLNKEEHPDILAIESGMYGGYLEPMYDEVYGLLTDDSVVTITDKQRAQILFSVYQLYFRNPIHLKNAINMQLSILELRYNEAKSNEIDEIIFIDEKYDIKNMSLMELQEKFSEFIRDSFKTGHIERYLELVRARTHDSIIIYKITDDSSFITSNNPLSNFSIHNFTSHDPFVGDMQFLLPLNGKYCLSLDKNKGIDPNEIPRIDIDKIFSRAVNKLIVDRAPRFIIGSKEAIQDFTTNYAGFYSNTINSQTIDFIKDVYKRCIEETPELSFMKFYIDIYDTTGTLSEEQYSEMTLKYAEIVKQLDIDKSPAGSWKR